MAKDITVIRQKVDDIFDKVVEIRRHIHMDPELGEHEEKTAAYISSKLSEIGIDCKTGIAGHGVIGTIYGKDKTRAAAIRADIDALPVTETVDTPYKSKIPGVMHACGHDVHTAMLLGAAMVLKSMESELPASIRLLFQPSEETIGGAERMIQEGCLKDPDVSSVIGFHVDPSQPAGKIRMLDGPMNAASCEFNVSVFGKSSHGAHPDKGVDALLPACTMVTSLQSIITRRMDPADPCLITVGTFHSGTKENIISGQADFNGIIRTFSLENRDFIKSEIVKVCENTAAAFSAACDVRFSDSYPSLENNHELYCLIKDVAEDALGSENVVTGGLPSLGADDFAYFCHGTRGMYLDLGSAFPGEESYPLHSDNFCPDEECMKTGILIEVLSVLKILEEESEK